MSQLFYTMYPRGSSKFTVSNLLYSLHAEENRSALIALMLTNSFMNKLCKLCQINYQSGANQNYIFS